MSGAVNIIIMKRVAAARSVLPSLPVVFSTIHCALSEQFPQSNNRQLADRSRGQLIDKNVGFLVALQCVCVCVCVCLTSHWPTRAENSDVFHKTLHRR